MLQKVQTLYEIIKTTCNSDNNIMMCHCILFKVILMYNAKCTIKTTKTKKYVIVLLITILRI